MKLIVAIVKPFKVDDVKEALHDARRAGPHRFGGAGLRSPARPHRGVPRRGVHRRLRAEGPLEILVDDDDAQRVVDGLMAAARTGKIGDGKVWVVPIESAYRIRTGEAGSDAL